MEALFDYLLQDRFFVSSTLRCTLGIGVDSVGDAKAYSKLLDDFDRPMNGRRGRNNADNDFDGLVASFENHELPAGSAAQNQAWHGGRGRRLAAGIERGRLR